ncbi:transmembrane protein 216 isoform X2 [Myotis daubentonii]|uniref:transmembrane protein 216 isoform X2 n=1 Tax=Myotis daubentonii TaxID=98922 RepID=UPI0028731B73|nr:transmembrane protein 216 isoform X2 [Myotis daubentonii]
MQFPWGPRMAARGERLSSTPLEILFFLNGWYYATYFLLELLIFLYKGLLLPYPTANLVLDVAMLLLSLGIEVIRLFFDPAPREREPAWKQALWVNDSTPLLLPLYKAARPHAGRLPLPRQSAAAHPPFLRAREAAWR